MNKKKTLACFALAAAIFIIFFLFFLKDYIWDNKTNAKKIKRLSASLEITPVSNKSLILCDNGIIVEAEGVNIKAKGIEGKILWSLKLENTIKDLFSCASHLIIITDKNNIVTIDGSGKILWQYEMPITPSYILNDDKEFLIIQYNWPEYNTFEVFSTKGVKSCTGIIDKSHILSFSTSFGKYFTMSLLDISSDKVLSKVATYNNKGEMLWANNYENILVPKVWDGSKDTVVVCGENFIKKFKQNGKLVKEINFTDTISTLSISDSLIIVVSKKNNYYDICSYDLNFKQLGASATVNKPKGIFVGKDEYLLYDKDNLSLSNKYGKIIAVYESNIDINDAYIHDDGSIYVISNRKLLKLSQIKR